MTEAHGDTDSVPVTAFVMTDRTQPFLYYRSQQVPSVGQAPEGATPEGSVNGTAATVFDTT